MSDKVTVVAVDGPAASGKSTVSKLLAKKLGFIYVDSGAMYRAVTWQALEMGVDVTDNIAVIGMMHTIKISFEIVDGAARMLINGVDPGDKIREPRVAEKVSIVAAIPEVRQILVQQQRSLTKFGSLVMEGRDIGSVVFPDTPFKFYLDARPEIRAQRRQRDFAAMNIQTSAEHVAQNLQARDKLDSGRATAPLQIALGATVIENSRLTVEETVEVILQHIRRHQQATGKA
jgi:cytidylate kinase